MWAGERGPKRRFGGTLTREQRIDEEEEERRRAREQAATAAVTGIKDGGSGRDVRAGAHLGSVSQAARVHIVTANKPGRDVRRNLDAARALGLGRWAERCNETANDGGSVHAHPGGGVFAACGYVCVCACVWEVDAAPQRLIGPHPRHGTWICTRARRRLCGARQEA